MLYYKNNSQVFGMIPPHKGKRLFKDTQIILIKMNMKYPIALYIQKNLS